jgi:hypothetical protein
MGSWGLTTTVGTNLNKLINYQAGTNMHELGHNLGLKHGGDSSTTASEYKPNYYSTMNYLYQLYGLDSSPSGINAYQRWRMLKGDGTPTICNLTNSPCDPPSQFIINYSDGTGSSLNESALLESNNIGRGSTSGAYADWDLNGVKTTTTLSKDLNADGTKTTLTDYNDWGNLVLPFSRYYQGQFGVSTFSINNTNNQTLDPVSNDKQAWSIETPPSAKFFEDLRNVR